MGVIAIFRQLRSMPIMPTVAALLRGGGSRQFAAGGAVVEKHLVCRISKDSGRCSQLKRFIAVPSEAQHVRFVAEHSGVDFVFLRFTLRRFVTGPLHGLHRSEQMTLRFALHLGHEVCVETNDIVGDLGIQFHSAFTEQMITDANRRCRKLAPLFRLFEGQ
jgi:hypothetical protein